MNDLDLYNALAAKMSVTLDGYLKYVVCDSRPPKRLSLIVEPWQQQFYNLLKPLFECATGHRTDVAVKAAFVTAGRGTSKTSTVAQFSNWSLCYSKRPVSITVAASDGEQAEIMMQRMRAEASHNPWLDINFGRRQATGPTGNLTVLTSDAPSASGRLDDILIIDEVSWHKSRALTDILFSGRQKRKDGVLIVLSNCGLKDTWQHDLWLAAKSSPRWVAHEIPPFSASWLDRAAIEDDRKIMLSSLYKRVHLCEWVDLTEDSGYLTREQLLECVDDSLCYRLGAA